MYLTYYYYTEDIHDAEKVQIFTQKEKEEIKEELSKNSSTKQPSIKVQLVLSPGRRLSALRALQLSCLTLTILVYHTEPHQKVLHGLN